MAAKDRIQQAERRAQQMAGMTDPQFVDDYVTTLKSPKNINYSPYLITAIRDAGLWDRLDSALRRNAGKDSP